MFKKGKIEGIKDQLDGYTKLNKADMQPNEGLLIDGIIKGYSADNGDFVYVRGYYQAKPVFVAVPSANLDDFMEITSSSPTLNSAKGISVRSEVS